jgi:DNA-binding transcriptional MerR regulator
MPKSPQAFRTISEVSGLLDVPAHVLRFWESRFPQIRPMKSSGGRRYYRPADVDLLRGIRELLYGDGLTIKGVQKVFREHGAAIVSARGVAAGAAEEPDRAALPSTVLAPDEAALWDDTEFGRLLAAEAAPPPPSPETLRRARVAEAIARLEAIRARILSGLAG